MIEKTYKYSDLTGKIIGYAMNVHNILGSGFQEVIYQRALSIELEEAGLRHQREMEMKIYYRDQEIGTRRVDFLIDEKIMVEIKAVSELNNLHLAQAINYFEAYNLEIGLLINFGEKSLKFKRITNEHKVRKKSL